MKINGTNQTNLENVKTFTNQRETNFEPMFQYGNFDQDNNKKDISDAKIITENFKDQIMGHLDTSKSTKSIDTVKYYLNKLVEIVQILNGIQKNNLKPQGNSEQNRTYFINAQKINTYSIAKKKSSSNRLSDLHDAIELFTSIIGSNIQCRDILSYH